jgi:hypothetical protein
LYKNLTHLILICIKNKKPSTKVEGFYKTYLF